MLTTVHLYRTLQLDVFVLCPITLASSRPGIQALAPSVMTLTFRWTRDQCDDFIPFLATVHLYRILQLAVFLFCPFTPTFSHLVDAEIQGILPSAPTLFFVRPGTSAATSSQLLPPCVCTEFFRLMSSFFIHVPLHPFALRTMLGSNTSFHLFRHCFCVRPGTIAAILFQFLPPCVCTEFFSLLSSSSVHLPLR
jgi:hypothetical protein